jgi:Protein of unknown function (DUF1592)/Protein of unknown function (DUF1588)/Protein of unknown function (DUF1595)/Protein of unknown function (DUF1587)
MSRFGQAGAIWSALFAVVSLASACRGVVGGGGGGPVDPTKPGVTGSAATTGTTGAAATTGAAGAAGTAGATQRPDGTFACDPATGPSVSPLRRLSVLQYRNTLRDLFGSTLDVTTVAADELARIPVDDAAFTIMDTRLSDQHVRGYQRIADKIATAATTADASLRAVAGACGLDAAPTVACVDAFLKDFGTRALRRPLLAEEKTAYVALNDGTRNTRELFRALMFVLLQSPSFAYHVEVDGQATAAADDNYFRLDAYALASRLSYHFWQSMPDAALFAAAADGSLLTDGVFTAQVDRLFKDPRTRDAISVFYKEWWHVGWLSAFPDTPAYRRLAQGTTVFTQGADHLTAMTDEIRAMTEHLTFTTPGTYKDLLLTDLSFTRSPHLAALYGVQPWDGSSAYPHMPAGERAGILTRGSFLVNDNYTTHPIHRGIVVKRRLLCQEIPQPDPTSLPAGALVPPPIAADTTTRQRYENKTSPALCNACHGSFNPIGFVLERYDALGRTRTQELVLDEATGNLLATLPIDSSAAPRINMGDDRVIQTGPELSQMVAASSSVEPCFARQYFRFTYARTEGDADNCALEGVRSALSGGSLAGALRAIALDASFRSRRAM